MVRRPPLVYQGSVTTGVTDPLQVKTVGIKDDLDNDWSLVFYRSDKVEVKAHRSNDGFKLSNVVITDAAQAYLDSSAVLSLDLEARTVADRTFIWNRNVAAAEVISDTPSGDEDVAYYVDIREIRLDAVNRLSIGLEVGNGFANLSASLYVGTDLVRGADQPPFDTTGRETSLLFQNTTHGTIAYFESQSLLDQTRARVVDGLVETLNLDGDVVENITINNFLWDASNHQDRYVFLRPRDSATDLPFTEQSIIAGGYTDAEGDLNPATVDNTRFFSVGTSGNPGGFLDWPVVKTTVPTFADLPAEAPSSITFTVEDGPSFWTYDPSFGTGGGFREGGAVGQTGLDVNTMPLGASYDRDLDTWTIDVLPWEQRSPSADPALIPNPPFLGRAIRDISFFRSRLLLVYRGGAMLSSPGDILSFYPDSEITTLAEDPIALANTRSEDTQFLWAVPFNKRVLIMARDAVFELVSLGGTLTEDTADLQTITEIPVTEKIRPFATAGLMFFGTPTGDNDLDLSEYTIGNGGGTQVLNELSVPDTSTLLNPTLFTGETFSAATLKSLFRTLYFPQGSSQGILHSYRQVLGRRTQNCFTEFHLPDFLRVVGQVAVDSKVGIHVLTDEGEVVYATTDFRRRDRNKLIHLDLQTLTGDDLEGSQETVSVRIEGSFAMDEPDDAIAGEFLHGYAAPAASWELPEPHVFSGRDRTQDAVIFLPQAVCQRGSIRLQDTGAIAVTNNFYSERIHSLDAEVRDGTDGLLFNSLYTGPTDFTTGDRLDETLLSVSSVSHLPANLISLDLRIRHNPRA